MDKFTQIREDITQKGLKGFPLCCVFQAVIPILITWRLLGMYGVFLLIVLNLALYATWRYMPPNWVSSVTTNGCRNSTEFLCSHAQQAPAEFTVGECTCRYIRVLCYFYFFLAACPMKFARAFFVHTLFIPPDGVGMKGKGPLKARWLALTMPVWPFIVFWWCVLECCNPKHWILKVQQDAGGLPSDDRYLSRLLHANFLIIALKVNYFLTGENELAVPQSTKTLSKDFWRSLFTRCGEKVPPEVARWEKGTLTWKIPYTGNDLICKLESGAFSSGDHVLRKEDVDGQDGAERKLKEVLPSDKTYLVLDRVYPTKSLGVHSFDLSTVVASNGDVYVAYMGMVYSSEDFNSNHAKAACRISVESEICLGPDQWFRNRRTSFNSQAGLKIPGVKAIGEKAVEMHKELLKEHKSRNFVAWDVMLTENGRIWFEGNTTQLRLGRIAYSSWGGMLALMQETVAKYRDTGKEKNQ